MTDKIGAFERLMSRKVEAWAVGIIVAGLAAASILFASVVMRQATGDHDFGAAGDAAVAIASLPGTAKDTAKLLLKGRHAELAAEEQRFGKEAGFHFSYPAGSEPDAGYLLLSRYDGDARRSVVELIDLDSQKTLHRWTPDFAAINARSTVKSNLTVLARDNAPRRARMFHPAPTADGGLIFQNMSPLVKIGACGEIDWMIDGIFHHSVEPAPDGGYWASRFLEPQTVRGVADTFKEDAIVHVSETGEVLFQKSLVDILRDNNLKRLVFGLDFYSDDPTHLNDIQPAFADGAHWRRGDLLLSLRNTSSLMLYRPADNRVLWTQSGPWVNQHDVGFVGDGVVSVFNNNRMNNAGKSYVDGSNDIMVYDFASDHVSSPWKGALRALDVRTISEGRSNVLPGGDLFVEESNNGRTMRIDANGAVVWSHVNRAADGKVYLGNWSRYLPPEQGKALAKTLARTACNAP